MPDIGSFSGPGIGAFVGVLLGQVIRGRLSRTRGTYVSGRGRALSLECSARLADGQHPHLGRRWRPGRAVVSRGAVELTTYRWGVRVWRHPAFTLEIASVDRSSVRRASWWTDTNACTSVRVVTVTTSEGSEVDLVLPTDDVDDVLDVVEGLPLRAPSATSAPSAGPAPELPELPQGWVWSTERTAHVTSRTPVDAAGAPLHPGDVTGQLGLALDDVEQQLAQEQIPLSGLERLRVRTTDPHAVGACIPALAERLRAAGATPSITVLAVERLDGPGQLVELDVTAFAL